MSFFWGGGGHCVVFCLFVCLIDGAFWPTGGNISSESFGGGLFFFLINQIISISKINIKNSWQMIFHY